MTIFLATISQQICPNSDPNNCLYKQVAQWVQFSQISIQKIVPQNESLSGKFDNLSVDNRMSHTCGHYEPINSTQIALLIGVMAFDFSIFFFEHTVVTNARFAYIRNTMKLSKWMNKSTVFLERPWKTSTKCAKCCNGPFIDSLCLPLAGNI